jgi:hypothetical protein
MQVVFLGALHFTLVIFSSYNWIKKCMILQGAFNLVSKKISFENVETSKLGTSIDFLTSN